MMKQFFILFIIVTFPFFSGNAADLTIQQQITGTDSVPPTIPAPVSATAVSSSQIDVTWGISTDDQSVAGYRLFRNGVHIATTTLLTYSDTGLTASTTYVYTVQAFDTSFNVSTTSVSATSTTLSTPISSVSSAGNTVESYVHVRLLSQDIAVGIHEVAISWDTNIYAQYLLRWGKTDSYNIGFIKNDIFKRSHSTVIPDLEPDTTYVYELIAYSQQGTEFVLTQDSFTTAESPDVTPTLNVTNLQADTQGDSILLSWDNPRDLDFQKVRVVRSDIFYPRDVFDGYVVYEGSREYVLDTDAFSTGSTQFYTIFAYDSSGNVSSGALTVVRKNKNTTDNSLPGVHLSESDNNTRFDILFSDVLFFQDGKRMNELKDGGSFVTEKSVLIQVPNARIPEFIKTVVVSIRNTEGHKEAYFLQQNTHTQVYEVTLPPFTQPEVLEVSFLLYDLRKDLRHSFGGYMSVYKTDTTLISIDDNVSKVSHVQNKILPITGVILIYIFILFIFWKRRKKS